MTKKKNGRNKPNKNALKDLDERQIYELAKLFLMKSEIAAVMNCHVDTITNRFQEVYLKGREEGKSTLRRHQLNVAYKGNATMLIWLGKQYLGQKDVELTGMLSDAEIERLRLIATKEINENM